MSKTKWILFALALIICFSLGVIFALADNYK